MTVATRSTEVRTIEPADTGAWYEAVSTAFLDRPDIAALVELAREVWDYRRVWAAFDGDAVCGTFRTWATDLTVPGGRHVPGSAVAGVSVLPTHRRRGILRSMARTGHAAARDQGEVVAILYASEYPIYGRLGYGPACRLATWTLDALATGFHRPARGSVELLVAGPEARDVVKDVFESVRTGRPGEIRRRDYHWDIDLGIRASPWGRSWKGFLAVHRDEGGAADGYVRYHAEERWEQRQPRSTIVVDDLQALTDDAYAALWRFLTEIDLASTVKAEGRSPSEQLPWLLTNGRAAQVSEIGDGLWLRLLDVARALEARTYETAARLVLEAVDPELPDGRVRVELDAAPDGASCRPTGRSPDLTVPVEALGAAYLGGTRLSDAAVATGVDEHRRGALAEADRLLRTGDEPRCSTFF